MPALSSAEKQRQYRARHAARIAATRPTAVRDALESFVVDNLDGARKRAHAAGAIEFAQVAGLITPEEASDMRTMIVAGSVRG